MFVLWNEIFVLLLHNLTDGIPEKTLQVVIIHGINLHVHVILSRPVVVVYRRIIASLKLPNAYYKCTS